MYAFEGTTAEYKHRHYRIAEEHGKATFCIWGCERKRYEWANLTGNYRDPDDFAAMCISCHRRYDDARRSMEPGFTKHPRGASQPGERNGMAKLTAEKVAEIRRRRAAGETTVAIAADFGVSHTTVSLIARGKHWKA
jgi:hypothetical protein